MKLLLIVACLVGAACAVTHDKEDCCSVEDKKEIAWLWHNFWHSAYTDKKVRIMRAVVHDMIEKHPDAKALLEAKNLGDDHSPEFRAYVVRLVHGFDNIINLLDDPQVLQEQLHYMADYFGTKAGLHKSYFEALADSLETVMAKVSSCFNVAAWTRCLDRLAHIIAEKVAD